MSLPLLAAVAYALSPEPSTDPGLTTAQTALLVGFLAALAVGRMLLLSFLLLRRSRVGWLLAVGAGLVGVALPPPADLRPTTSC